MHGDLRQWRVHQPVEELPARAAAVVAPGGNAFLDEVHDRTDAGDGHVREALPSIGDVGEGIHHLHPGGQLPEHAPGLAVVREILRPVGFVGDVEERGLEDALSGQESVQCRKVLGQEVAVGRRGRTGRGTPEELFVPALALVHADGVAGAPLGNGVAPLEVADARRARGVDVAFHVPPVEAIRIVPRPRHAQELAGPFDAVEGRREDGDVHGVQVVLGQVAHVLRQDPPESPIEQVGSVPIDQRIDVEPVGDGELLSSLEGNIVELHGHGVGLPAASLWVKHDFDPVASG